MGTAFSYNKTKPQETKLVVYKDIEYFLEKFNEIKLFPAIVQ